MHENLSKFKGMMARFNVDDKGTIMFAAFGPPPTQHDNDPARAVLCGLKIFSDLKRMGHEVGCEAATA